MKKINLLFAMMLLTLGVAFAQAPPGKGGSQLNAGLGFSSYGVPIYFGADFGVHEDITIGPKISFRNYDYNAAGDDWDQNLTVIAFNGNYHFNRLLNMPSEWNFYAGLSLGYYIWSDIEYGDAKSSSFGLDAQIGGRYFFSDKFGINLEFGGGTASGGSFGITYRIK
ncbi:MAG: hypothetical protein MUC73_02675 [Cyclobacteriaceae bacterium]|jgi:hypothetical protein|nr:hypothetical protein [Cyclobacteriaceae bacterium]